MELLGEIVNSFHYSAAKIRLSPFKKNALFASPKALYENDENDENVLYVPLKAPFVLKIFKFSS